MTTPALLTELLREVSRSFYLTVRVLPAPVRPQIGLAYLLARIADTIADTGLVPVKERLAALDELRGRINGTRNVPLDFGRFLGVPGVDADAAAPPDEPDRPRGARPSGAATAGDPESRLLERVEDAIALLARFPAEDQQRIREVLSTITSGQELDLRRFSAASSRQLIALSTDTELQDYTYRVAGCVGEFWTRLCRARLFPRARVDDDKLLALATRFGQGLQLVNILRDLPADLRLGRCYLPRERLSPEGLTPEDLLDPHTMPRFRALYGTYLDQAEACLVDGWAYTDRLPRGQVRVRLACAWPLLIGIRTLAQLRSGNVLDGRRRIKLSRAEVRRILTASVLRYPFRRAWNRLFEMSRSRRG